MSKKKNLKTSDSMFLRHQCLTTITTDLELLRANNPGKIPLGDISRIVGEYKIPFLGWTKLLWKPILEN